MSYAMNERQSRLQAVKAAVLHQLSLSSADTHYVMGTMPDTLGQRRYLDPQGDTDGNVTSVNMAAPQYIAPRPLDVVQRCCESAMARNVVHGTVEPVLLRDALTDELRGIDSSLASLDWAF